MHVLPWRQLLSSRVAQTTGGHSRPGQPPRNQMGPPRSSCVHVPAWPLQLFRRRPSEVNASPGLRILSSALAAKLAARPARASSAGITSLTFTVARDTDIKRVPSRPLCALPAHQVQVRPPAVTCYNELDHVRPRLVREQLDRFDTRVV